MARTRTVCRQDGPAGRRFGSRRSGTHHDNGPDNAVGGYVMEWTQDDLDQLARLWAEGKSTSLIASEMNTTKNAIVGKAHRLRLPSRPSPIRRKDPVIADRNRKILADSERGDTAEAIAARYGVMPHVVYYVRHAARNRGKMAAPVATLPPLASLSGPAPRPITQPNHPSSTVAARLAPPPARPYGRVVSCAWPIGDPGTRSFRFCDASSEPGRPYCGEHCAKAFVRTRKMEEAA